MIKTNNNKKQSFPLAASCLYEWPVRHPRHLEAQTIPCAFLEPLSCERQEGTDEAYAEGPALPASLLRGLLLPFATTFLKCLLFCLWKL